jgi:hypothetical protein
MAADRPIGFDAVFTSPRTRWARMVEQSSTHFCLNWRKSGSTNMDPTGVAEGKASQVHAHVSEMAERLLPRRGRSARAGS